MGFFDFINGFHITADGGFALLVMFCIIYTFVFTVVDIAKFIKSRIGKKD